MNITPVYFKLGALAAHTQGEKKGFRQKDVRFFAELFSNWIQLGGMGAVFYMHNTQILRYLSSLVSDGQAKIISRTKPPVYRLNRAGLFTILSEIVNKSYLTERSECMLVWYFLKSYSSQIKDILTKAGTEFSKAHKLEMEELLNIDEFLKKQIQFTIYEIARLQLRVTAAEEMSKSVEKLLKEGTSVSDCISHVAKNYPYELNSQKSFDELLNNLPEDVMYWELLHGGHLKAQGIFEPLLNEVLRFQEYLYKLQKTT